jgi:peroxiredoxin
MNYNLRNKAYVVLLLIFCFAGSIFAQRPVRMGPASPDEIKKARTYVDANFDSLKAHKAYIYAMGLSNPILANQYRIWIKKYPQKVIIPLSIGTAYYNAEMPQAREFLLSAAVIDPKNAKIWSMLSADAFTRGEKRTADKYLKKAALADSSNINYAVSYVMSFEDSNPIEFKQKVYDFLKRFPANEKGAYVLYWLAEDATNINDRVNYFEELRKLYPPQKYNWSASGMTGLADAYIQTDPEKALTLANEMGGAGDWKLRKQVAEALIKVNKLEQDQNYKEAVTTLDQVILPKVNYLDDFIALKKAVSRDNAGDVKVAYDSLAIKFARIPTDQVYTALNLYGRKMGKNEQQVVKDIETIRNRTAVAAYPFDLGLYTGTGKLNLKDLKGKVVLLTFWFPACSPCRAEFPHFEAVLNKFKGEDVKYVGINVFPGQDGYVLPMMENTKFSFIPLHGTQEFAKNNYGVESEPKNFLIDKDGKIVFKDFSINNTNHRTLELMISSLLHKGQPNN